MCVLRDVLVRIYRLMDVSFYNKYVWTLERCNGEYFCVLLIALASPVLWHEDHPFHLNFWMDSYHWIWIEIGLYIVTVSISLRFQVETPIILVGCQSWVMQRSQWLNRECKWCTRFRTLCGINLRPHHSGDSEYYCFPLWLDWLERRLS